MNFTKNLKFLFELLKYTSKGFSICKIYQILELKKHSMKGEIIEFGTIDYQESLIKHIKKKSSNIYFSNLFDFKKKNYFKINLEKKK